MPCINEVKDRKISAVIFDMDNTLFDFVEAKIAACEAVTRFIGLDCTMQLLYYFLRDGRHFEDLEHIREFLADNGIPEEKFPECCRIYEETKLRIIHPYINIRETLLKLKEMGLVLLVVTDARTKNAVARLEKTGLFSLFDFVVTSDMTGMKKPDPGVFLFALKRFGIRPEEVLVVGDSLRRDIGPAKKAGMRTAYASYGDRNFHEERIEKADVILADIKDVLQVVEENHLV